MHDSGLADVDNAHPTFYLPIPHNLHPLTLSSTHLAFGLLEPNNRVELLHVAACKRRKMHRERLASAKRAMHAQGLRGYPVE
jgi:hypothetical protein